MSQEMKDLLLVILRATYQNTRQVRELKGCIITTVKVDDTDPLVEAIETENRSYAKMIRQEGENHGKGPPAPGAAMAMMESLVKQDIGAKSKEELTAAIQAINELDAYEAQDMFPICKVEKA
jgi:hypothetical protein